MSVRYLLDTNILSYLIRNVSPALNARMELALQLSEVATSAICRGELRYGQALMNVQDRRRLAIDQCLEQLPSLDWTVAAADRYGTLRAALHRAGRPIGELDTQIAAHALATKLILVTHNTRHFDHIPGLQLEDWVEPSAATP